MKSYRRFISIFEIEIKTKSEKNMKNLSTKDIKSVTGGLAYTGGDWAAYEELMRKYPYLLNV